MKRIFEMKSFGVYLSRNKFYTLVNVVGFSVSLMFVILIMLYARQEYSVDKIIDKPTVSTRCVHTKVRTSMLMLRREATGSPSAPSRKPFRRWR